MKAYKVKGEFKDPRKQQDFTLEVAAEGPEEAKEKVLCLIGSKHKQKRWMINIDSVEEMAAEDVRDQTVLYQIGA